jgi:putative transposase
VGRLHVSTLMKKMAIAALSRRPNRSKPAPGHKVYPYLLRTLAATRPNQVWAMDITDIPMARGFAYLAAVVDWFSREVLAWRLSITLSADFRVEALEEALGRHGRPEIFKSDQGSQFTSADVIKILKGEPRRPPPVQGPWRTRSPSAWTARAPGATTSSSNGSGGRSNTRRFTCAPTAASPRRGPRLVAISDSTTERGPIRRWAGGRRTRPILTGRRRSRRRRNQGGDPLNGSPEAVQVNRASSHHAIDLKSPDDGQ